MHYHSVISKAEGLDVNNPPEILNIIHPVLENLLYGGVLADVPNERPGGKLIKETPVVPILLATIGEGDCDGEGGGNPKPYAGDLSVLGFNVQGKTAPFIEQLPAFR